jgi:hypothetical protein
MSAQTTASQRWETSRHMANIEALQAQALDYSYPAGQAQAALQLANVEVPWLLAEIERLILKEQSNDQHRAAA